MELEIGHVITLEDNKDYIILKKVNYNNAIYIYLMTASKPVDVAIVKEEIINNEIILNPIEDENELNYIISLLELENN